MMIVVAENVTTKDGNHILLNIITSIFYAKSIYIAKKSANMLVIVENADNDVNVVKQK